MSMRQRQEVQVLLRPAPKTVKDVLILLGRFVPLECFRDGRLHFLATKILRQDLLSLNKLMAFVRLVEQQVDCGVLCCPLRLRSYLRALSSTRA